MASSSESVRDLKARWDDITLEEEEDGLLALKILSEAIYELTIDTRWCPVGKLLRGRESDFNIFQNMMAYIWQPGKECM